VGISILGLVVVRRQHLSVPFITKSMREDLHFAVKQQPVHNFYSGMLYLFPWSAKIGLLMVLSFLKKF
jgi:hypothetical protein